MVSGKEGAIGGLSVLAFDFTLKVNSLELGTGRLRGSDLTGEDKAQGGAAGTNGGDWVWFCEEGNGRTGRCGRATTLEGLKPGG